MLETFNTSAQFTTDSPPIHVASVLNSNTGGSGEQHEADANAAPELQQAKLLIQILDAVGASRDKISQLASYVVSLRGRK